MISPHGMQAFLLVFGEPYPKRPHLCTIAQKEILDFGFSKQHSITPQPYTLGKSEQELRIFPKVRGLHTVRPKTERSPDTCRK